MSLTLPDWLVLAGGLFQFVGIVVTLLGVRKTHREFGARERHLADTLRQVVETTSTGLGRIAGASGPSRVEGQLNAISPEPTARGSGTVSAPSGSLYDAADIPNSVRKIDERLRHAFAYAVQVSVKSDAANTSVINEITDLEQRLVGSIKQLEATDQRIAIGDVKEVVSGLALIAFGVALQSVSVLV